MKNEPRADFTPKPVRFATAALDITRAKPLPNWEQKMRLEEDLKKTIDMYIVRVGSKGALMRNCSWSA
jgi:nucleoside-diphosphate-sugar epimerase